MPQISQAGLIYASQLFWLAIVFALIYFGIGRGMVPKIEGTIEGRQARIQGDLATAETARARSHAIDEEYEAGLDTARQHALAGMAAARAQAISASEERLKTASEKVDADVTAATQRIAKVKRAALGELESSTVELVENIVARLSGVKIEREAVEARVRADAAHG